jgi:predicted secreted protein
VLRRDCLAVGIGVGMGVAAALAPQAAVAEVLNVSQAELLARNLKSDGIRMEFPPLADTGFSIPLSAQITAPPGLLIDVVEVFVPENPNTRAFKLRLATPQARFVFSTRLRLAASQDAWVVVTLTDGSQRGVSAPTVITSSACFDGS